ncbi:fumarylacetoacetate hydrolase family protein [Shinella sp. S4-D37]|uniref:fumarylacetoacetate hydrolase family protein n=1 Tax=Shinella sp. S4-D37 TaxID=3161999 RepID=UPI0034652087
MKICRFNDNRLGLVQGEVIGDVTHVLDLLPSIRWPAPHGDLLIENLPVILEALNGLDLPGTVHRVQDVKLLSPVANPSKIIGAPANFMPEDGSTPKRTARDIGMFLKATSSICGAGEGVIADWPGWIVEHEIELAVVIGRKGFAISEKDALGYIAGYTIGLDMTARGTQDRSFRKSFDSFSVLGPWLVTPDELGDPNVVELMLSVDGKCMQHASTASLILNIQQLVEYTSSIYTLHPGDVLMSGSPDGVSPVSAGARIDASISGIGTMEVFARALE